ncbi:MAG TPA: S9 family peptidase [Ilumatobacteraceae bacterium]|nr:S9 family peptidase [Ilumatobacteraceae bacterium]
MSALPPPPPPAEPERGHREIAERLIDRRSQVTQVAVSPDGAHVAFVVATTDLAKNTTRTLLWLDDVPVTAGEHDGSPAWSHDGRFLAFTSRRGEKKGDSTLHILPVGAPGEVRTVCTMPDGLGAVAWSPDGRWIAFTSRTRDARYAAEDVSWQSPRKVERFFSRLNGEDWIFDRPNHVYVVAADGTGMPRNLTPGEFQHDGISWLPDSTGLVTSARRHATGDRDRAVDLYVVALTQPPDGDDDAIRCLTAHDGRYGSASVSPDGTLVAFVGVGDPSTPQNTKVGILPIDTHNTPESGIRWISAGFDRTFVTNSGAPEPVWESNTHLLAAAEDRGTTNLYRIPADGSFVPAPLTDGPVTVTSFDAAAGVVATVRSVVDHPAELYVGNDRRTHVGDEFSAQLLGWERFTARTTDGTEEIDAWIMRPADFDDTRRYPVLLNVHGGPHTQYGEQFVDEFQMQAAAGFVVVLGNPRGSSGRHTGWGQSILGPHHPVRPGTGWGSVDVDDVLAIIDTALDRYDFCDPDRVGMLGGSYGGFMATWLAAHHSDRFRAFCSERAVNNLISEEWSSDIATFFISEHGASHLDMPEEYERRSPVSAVRNIDKPMLLIHSENDWRCPIGQAEELWVALKLLGKEVDFYRFPGENHELSRSGSPVHRMQRAEIILDWFSDKLTPVGDD